jgi:hypothetical protein
MASSVHDGNYRNMIGENSIDHQVGELSEQSQASLTVNSREDFWLPGDKSKTRINAADELSA